MTEHPKRSFNFSFLRLKDICLWIRTSQGKKVEGFNCWRIWMCSSHYDRLTGKIIVPILILLFSTFRQHLNKKRHQTQTQGWILLLNPLESTLHSEHWTETNARPELNAKNKTFSVWFNKPSLWHAIYISDCVCVCQRRTKIPIQCLASNNWQTHLVYLFAGAYTLVRTFIQFMPSTVLKCANEIQSEKFCPLFLLSPFLFGV